MEGSRWNGYFIKSYKYLVLGHKVCWLTPSSTRGPGRQKEEAHCAVATLRSHVHGSSDRMAVGRPVSFCDTFVLCSTMLVHSTGHDVRFDCLAIVSFTYSQYGLRLWLCQVELSWCPHIDHAAR